ncbi:unnamed protein product [Symbiodinium natans]|uniref:Uncharacterized protein n=1 Tax=Symbiodinium natans TaxID=878477 RepID=A0A812TX84_9DINO|nr:unnamed protein product [Symbiodinium natans]
MSLPKEDDYHTMELSRRSIQISDLQEELDGGRERQRQAEDRSATLERQIEKLKVEISIRKSKTQEMDDQVAADEAACLKNQGLLQAASEAAQADLLRLQAELAEAEAAVEQSEAQAEARKAADAAEEEERRREAEEAKQASQLAAAQEAAQASQADVDKVQAELRDLEVTLDMEKKSTKELKESLVEAEERRDAARVECDRLARVLEALGSKGELQLLREALTSKIEAQQRHTQDLRSLRAKAGFERANKEAALNESRRILSQTPCQLDDTSSRLGTSSLAEARRQAETSRTKRLEMEAEAKQLDKEVSDLQGSFKLDLEQEHYESLKKGSNHAIRELTSFHHGMKSLHPDSFEFRPSSGVALSHRSYAVMRRTYASEISAEAGQAGAAAATEYGAGGSGHAKAEMQQKDRQKIGTGAIRANCSGVAPCLPYDLTDEPIRPRLSSHVGLAVKSKATAQKAADQASQPVGDPLTGEDEDLQTAYSDEDARQWSKMLPCELHLAGTTIQALLDHYAEDSDSEVSGLLGHSLGSHSLSALLLQFRGELSKACKVKEDHILMNSIYGRFLRPGSSVSAMLKSRSSIGPLESTGTSLVSSSVPYKERLGEEVVVRFFVVPEKDGDDFTKVVNSLRDSLASNKSSLLSGKLSDVVRHSSLTIGYQAGRRNSRIGTRTHGEIWTHGRVLEFTSNIGMPAHGGNVAACLVNR